MARITGIDAHLRRLQGMSGEKIAGPIRRALLATAGAIKVDAQVSITENSAGGSSGGKHQHIASLPGQPPNELHGDLAKNIEAALVPDELKATVTSNAPYAAIQEYGGTINHPGGTPYFIGKDGKAVFVSKQGYGAFHHLPVTKPHKITLPERPYMRPALERNRGLLAENLRQAVNAIIAGES